MNVGGPRIGGTVGVAVQGGTVRQGLWMTALEGRARLQLPTQRLQEPAWETGSDRSYECVKQQTRGKKVIARKSSARGLKGVQMGGQGPPLL